MIFRETWKGRIAACRRMLSVAIGSRPILVVRMPIVGSSSIWLYEGKAWIFPICGGLIVSDWSLFMRHIKRHNKFSNN